MTTTYTVDVFSTLDGFGAHGAVSVPTVLAPPRPTGPTPRGCCAHVGRAPGPTYNPPPQRAGRRSVRREETR